MFLKCVLDAVPVWYLYLMSKNSTVLSSSANEILLGK
jgi:hypothetical protein